MRAHFIVPCLVLAALAGCGDDKPESASDTRSEPTETTRAAAPSANTAPTRAEYIAKADRVCKSINAEAKRRNEEVRRVAARFSGGREALAAIAPLMRDGYKWQRRVNAEFKAVPFPPEDAEIIEKMIVASDERTALVGRLADAAGHGDVNAMAAIAEDQGRVTVRIRELAEGYGFKECGSGRNEAGPATPKARN